jgi:hypothetical protein
MGLGGSAGSGKKIDWAAANASPAAKPQNGPSPAYCAIDNPDYAAQKAFYENRAGHYTVEELVARKLADGQWRETVQRNNGVKDSEIPALLDKFALTYKEQMRAERTTDSSFAVQFSIWVKRYLEAMRREASYNARMAERDRRYHEHMDRLDWRNNPNRFESDRNARIAPLEYFQFDDPEHPENITHKRLAINENFAQVPGVPF